MSSETEPTPAKRPNTTRRRPSPALVIACLALVVALGGTSYAAITLPSNAVGTRQLRDRAVTSAKLANGVVQTRKLRARAVTASVLGDRSVTSAKLANGAVTSAKLAPGTINTTNVPAGAGVNVRYRYGTVIAGPGQQVSAYVACPAGMTVVGGGGTADRPSVVINDSAPFNSAAATWTGGPSDSWGIYVTNTDTTAYRTVGVYAVCLAESSR